MIFSESWKSFLNFYKIVRGHFDFILKLRAVLIFIHTVSPKKLIGCPDIFFLSRNLDKFSSALFGLSHNDDKNPGQPSGVPKS